MSKQKIIKKLLLQKKYANYKYINAIDFDDIIFLGINTFILLLKETAYIKDNFEKRLYFHLDDINYNRQIENDTNLIYIKITNATNIVLKKKLISLLEKFNIKYRLLYELEFSDDFIKNGIFYFIKNKNIIYYFKSLYQKKDIFWIKNNIKYFEKKEVYLSLDYIKKQDEINHENIFDIMEILQDNGLYINKDFIRLESVYKKLYILGPNELHLDFYEYCNANCVFCFTNGPGFLTARNDNENKYKQLFSAEEYLNLLSKIKRSGVTSLGLGITGEPLLHPDIKNILIGLNKIDIKIGFLTNGYLLLENMDLLLKNKNIEHFYINISSGDRDSFQKTRPNNDFKNFLNVWKAIKILRDKRPDIIIRCLYVITTENIDGIDNFLKLSIKHNISEIELKRVVQYEFTEKYMKFNTTHLKKLESIISKYKDISIRNNFDYILKDFKYAIKGVQNPLANNLDYKKLKPMTNHCYNPYYYIAIHRNTAFGCGKFISKIDKLGSFDLYKSLFINRNTDTILKSADNLSNLLGTKVHKTKCSRCHHMDINYIVEDFLKIKNLSVNIKNV